MPEDRPGCSLEKVLSDQWKVPAGRGSIRRHGYRDRRRAADGVHGRPVAVYALPKIQDASWACRNALRSWVIATRLAPGTALAAARSDAADAAGHQRDPTQCERGYRDFATVSQRPVAQLLQYRLGFRWRGHPCRFERARRWRS